MDAGHSTVGGTWQTSPELSKTPQNTPRTPNTPNCTALLLGAGSPTVVGDIVRQPPHLPKSHCPSPTNATSRPTRPLPSSCPVPLQNSGLPSCPQTPSALQGTPRAPQFSHRYPLTPYPAGEAPPAGGALSPGRWLLPGHFAAPPSAGGQGDRCDTTVTSRDPHGDTQSPRCHTRGTPSPPGCHTLGTPRDPWLQCPVAGLWGH